jgi:threonine/homoserine efflux transporter RhtA
MLIIALVLAVIGLAALVFAVVTSNELVAWVCIGASVLGVVLLIVDALRERQRREVGAATKTSGPAPGHELAGEEAADNPDGTAGEGDDASTPKDPGSEADAADSVSDDHNTR